MEPAFDALLRCRYARTTGGKLYKVSLVSIGAQRYRKYPAFLDRPKQGFSIPLAAWLRGPLRDWAEDLLTPAGLADDGLLNPVPIRHAWATHLAGQRDHAHALWAVLMLQAWRQNP